MDTPIDPMHLIKNIVSHAVNLIAGREDSHKVRAEEKFRNRFQSSWIKESSNSQLPPAPFCLSKEDMVPSGFDWHPQPIFSRNSGMKSHEWKQLAANGILKFCLRGMLGKNQRKTLYMLFDVITQICAEDIDMNFVDDCFSPSTPFANVFEEVWASILLLDVPF